MKKKIVNILKNPEYLFNYILYRGDLTKISDEKYIHLKYKRIMGKKLNLGNPITFNEKLQWLKLNDQNPKYPKLVDKYEVRKHIEEMIGDNYLIPLLGVWDNFDEIDFSKLPTKFVLKTNHDSGGVVICLDKNNFNILEAKKKLTESLNRNFYYESREWVYKDIPPKIICEAYLETEHGGLPNDYKFNCFGGNVDNVMVATGRETGSPKFYFFNKEWELLKYNYDGLNAPTNFNLPKPEKLQEMFEISRILSEKFPYVRVDLYYEKNIIYFGELTFYPSGGFDPYFLYETDLLFGEMIKF